MGRSSDHALEVLGFHQLLEVIGGYVQSSAGARIIQRLRPSPEPEAISRRRALYADLLKLREGSRSLPGLLVEELEDILVRPQPRDAVADGSELLMCGRQLSAVAEVRDFADHPDCAGLEAFLALTSELDDCPQLRQEILRSLDSDGTVLDNASPRLKEIRRSKNETERRLERTLEGLLRNADNADALQDKFVTRRNGRYVIPVKRDAQRAIPGLVHDVSSSGQTIFVEPAETLALGNTVQMLSGEERAEVRRILAALSDGVRRSIDALRRNGRVLAELDAAAAVARWAGDYSCVLPSFGRHLDLRAARHPLLMAQFRRDGGGRNVVPLDITLPRGTRTLAVTGSNTGGKTVALKTVGLLTQAAQSGLPVPVGADSVFEIFQHVLADIGDEQSISENLSTYSGHLRNISTILRVTGDGGRALILLDELGSGTDPLEGGAIACSVLTELASRNTLVFATTHLGVVKNFVHATPGMVNAAVRFNVESLQPEYVLDI
jgi:DNA mismatch repair protein MutS2